MPRESRSKSHSWLLFYCWCFDIFSDFRPLFQKLSILINLLSRRSELVSTVEIIWIDTDCQDDLNWYRLFRQPELILTVDTIWISIDYQGYLDLSRIPRPPYLLKRLYKMSHSYCRNRHRRRYRHRTPSVANPFSKLLKSILFTNIQHLCRKNLSLSFDSNLIRYLDLDFCFAFLLFLSLSLYSCIAIFHRSVSLTTEQQMII
jgi:hypothetical protein